MSTHRCAGWQVGEGFAMFGDIPHEDWTSALDSTAEELLWEAGLVEPPVDAFLIALRLGVLVTEDLALPGRAQIVRVAEGSEQPVAASPTIVLGDDQRFERRQFSVAHELGEFAAVRVFERLALDARQVPLGGREQVANALAGRLLLPRRWLAKEGDLCEWDLVALRDHFWTASHELIARRMLDMSPLVTITVFDQGEVTWRRSNFGRQLGGLTNAEYECWQECYQWGMPTVREAEIPQAGPATIRCWPVHEPDWKREILRMEIADIGM